MWCWDRATNSAEAEAEVEIEKYQTDTGDFCLLPVSYQLSTLVSLTMTVIISRLSPCSSSFNHDKVVNPEPWQSSYLNPNHDLTQTPTMLFLCQNIRSENAYRSSWRTQTFYFDVSFTGIADQSSQVKRRQGRNITVRNILNL